MRPTPTHLFLGIFRSPLVFQDKENKSLQARHPQNERTRKSLELCQTFSPRRALAPGLGTPDAPRRAGSARLEVRSHPESQLCHEQGIRPGRTPFLTGVGSLETYPTSANFQEPGVQIQIRTTNPKPPSGLLECWIARKLTPTPVIGNLPLYMGG